MYVINLTITEKSSVCVFKSTDLIILQSIPVLVPQTDFPQ